MQKVRSQSCMSPGHGCCQACCPAPLRPPPCSISQSSHNLLQLDLGSVPRGLLLIKNSHIWQTAPAVMILWDTSRPFEHWTLIYLGPRYQWRIVNRDGFPQTFLLLSTNVYRTSFVLIVPVACWRIALNPKKYLLPELTKRTQNTSLSFLYLCTFAWKEKIKKGQLWISLAYCIDYKITCRIVYFIVYHISSIVLWVVLCRPVQL